MKQNKQVDATLSGIMPKAADGEKSPAWKVALDILSALCVVLLLSIPLYYAANGNLGDSNQFAAIWFLALLFGGVGMFWIILTCEHTLNKIALAVPVLGSKLFLYAAAVLYVVGYFLLSKME